MKVAVYNMKGVEKGSITLGRRLSGPVRQDLIKRAVAAELAARRQPYGADPQAGKRTSAKYRGRRGIRHSMMNREMARMKRITSTRSLYMRARFVPQAVKGRKAHPPKAEKIWEKKVNKKERTAALFSAAAATLDKGWIEKRGYDLEYIKKIPIVVDDKMEEVSSIRDVRQVIDNFGLTDELEWLGEKKVRSGKGTMRGRKYKRKRGMLIVVENDRGIIRAARNLAGLEVCEVANIGVDMLAPGAEPGRLCIWTEGALKKMEEIA